MDDTIATEFATMGVSIPAELVEEEEVFEIWDINVALFQAFEALDTQWRFIAGFGAAIRTGLDYAGVEIVLRSRGLELDQLALIQTMESAALEAYHEAGS